MSKATRQRSARERLAEQLKREQERRRRLRTMLVSGGAIAAIAVVVAAVVLLRSGGDDTGTVATAPVTRQPDGSIVMAEPGVTGPVVEVFEDFQCPACQKFEEVSGKAIQELAAAGRAKVIYRPFSLFRTWPEPTKGNSARALNAAFCAPAGRWAAYHDKLFAEQGPEDKAGFSNDDLISWGRDVGITGSAFESCVNGGQKNSLTEQANAAAEKAGVQSTPWVTLNGTHLDNNTTFTPDALRRAVENAPSTATTSPPASAQ